MAVGKVSDADFEAEVLKASGPVVVDFWAEWCGPCRMIAPALDEISGAVGDKVGRIPVMWFSILGALPFALMLPYANLFWTGVLAVTVAMIMASAFSAILVYAQELMPGRVGLVAGMFFGFSFGLGGLGAAALGELADWTSIETVYKVTPFLLLLGILTAFLPRQPGEPRNSH